MTQKLNLDPTVVALARELAKRAGEPVTKLATTHSTVSIERAVLRLAGLDGADAAGMPWVNRVVDAVRDSTGLEHGVALPVWDAMLAGGYPDLRTLAEQAAAGQVKFRLPSGTDAIAARARAVRSAEEGVAAIDAQRALRSRMIADLADPPAPLIYLIVATGDIYEDIPQAQAAAREGADVIAVIRSTGQSLLDYVPEGATREGYAGTYATRENFRADARGAGRDVAGARPLRAADELRVRPVHAGDRHAGRARAAGHDAQRLHVRHPLPRHQPGAHVHRPAVLPRRCTPAPGSSSTPARTTT